LETDVKPRYPFGYGLSYTTFEYDGLTVSPEHIHADGEATVTVNVTNTGAIAGTEVVQLYVSDKVSSVTRPVKELKGFRKVTLEPGETKKVTFTLAKEHLQLFNQQLQPVVEEGEFRIMVGRNSEDFITASLFVKNEV
jgi:beta-glucosidase